jgi:hypothetical protein
MSDTNADDGSRSCIPRLRPTPVPFQINTRSTRYSEGGGTRQQPASAIPVAAIISRSPDGRLQIQLAVRVKIDNCIIESIPKFTGGPDESPDEFVARVVALATTEGWDDGQRIQVAVR